MLTAGAVGSGPGAVVPAAGLSVTGAIRVETT
jgi:hypothetical protein